MIPNPAPGAEAVTDEGPGAGLPQGNEPVPARGWLSAEQQAAWRAFQLMQTRLNAALAHDLSQHSDLSYQDYLVLVALTDEPGGELRLFQLAEFLGWEKSRISHQVSRMAERGLLAKSRCGSDRRGATVVVTGAGREAIKQAAPSHVEAVRRLFVGVLSAHELEQLEAACRRVLGAIAAEPTPEPC